MWGRLWNSDAKGHGDDPEDSDDEFDDVCSWSGDEDTDSGPPDTEFR